MLIDMHVHTSRYSACGRSTPQDMAAAALRAGLDAIVLTEHDTIWRRSEWQQLQDQYPDLKIFRGIEVTSDLQEHFLVIGILDPQLLWPFMDERQLFAAVETEQAAIIHAHPYRYGDKLPRRILQLRPHAVEYMSNNVRPDMQPRIKQLAAHHKCGLTASSDGHITDTVGMYATRLPRWPQTEKELAQVLRTASASLELVDGRNPAVGL